MFAAGFNRNISPARFWCCLSSEPGEIRYKLYRILAKTSMFSGVSATRCLVPLMQIVCIVLGFSRANAHFRHPCAGDSCAVLYSVLQLAAALPPSSHPSPGLLQLLQVLTQNNAELSSPQGTRIPPLFVFLLSQSCPWLLSGTPVTHPHYLFARILSQQAFPIPESGAKIIRLNGLSKSKKQADTRGIVTALCPSLWDSWPPVFPQNQEIQIDFRILLRRGRFSHIPVILEIRSIKSILNYREAVKFKKL